MESTPSIVSEQELIEILNAAEVKRLIPTMVFLLLILVLGISGNGFVCYIYRTKYTISSSRWFIFYLATMDLFICTLIVPVEFSTLFQQYNFTNDLWCKCSAFLNLWTILSLGLTLVIVSIDRYRKVCKPLGWQINFKKGKYLCIVATIVAVAIAVPIFSVYGIYRFQLKEFNVTASECSFRESSHNSKFPFIYTLIGMVMFVCALAVICIMYCFIGREIKQHIDKENVKRHLSLMSTASMARQSHQVRPVTLVSTISVGTKNVRFSENGVNMKKHFVSDQNSKCKMDTAKRESDDISIGNITEDDTFDLDFDVPIKHMTRKEKTKSKRIRIARAKKATFSMFLISTAFVLSYLPFLSLLLMRSVLNDFDESMTNEGRAVYKFFLRSYFLNCAINPFIYGISDSKFRDCCKSVISSICARLAKVTRQII